MLRLIFVQAFFLAIAASAAFADHGKGAVGGRTISPRTLHEESFSIETGFRYQRSEEFSDMKLEDEATNGHDIHSTRWMAEFSLAAAYGVTEHLTVSLSLPFEAMHRFREGEFDGVNPAEVVEATSVIGMGDATLLAKYSLLNDPIELSVLAGVKIPTGSTSQQNNEGERLESDHQPGTGTWDPILGIAVAHQFETWMLGASVLYRITSRGRYDFTPGQQVTIAVKAEYQLLGLGKFPRLYGSLEIFEEFRGQDRELSDRNHDTGGSMVGLGCGLRLRADAHMTLATTFTVPVYQGLNGVQHKERYEVLFGTGYDF